jgi:hypothetical protein
MVNVNKMTTISQKAIDKSLGSNRVIGRLMAHFDRHPETIKRWFINKDEALTTPPVLNVIREETGLTDSEILEETTIETATR